MIPAIANHLWQSSVFTGIAALLAWALRNNRAQTRYWIWLAASIKFLVPFALLTMLGSQYSWRKAPAAPQVPVLIEQIAQPAAAAPTIISAPKSTHALNPVPIFFGLWGCGFIFVTFRWFHRWRRIRAIMHASTPLPIQSHVPILSSPALIEPGVCGIFRPVLLLPEGILNRLAPAQLEAILAHEFCHIRRRDNVAAALHMLVEAIFWFHPLVWWIGARLIEERERACDEEVIRQGNLPETYAEGILQVCKFYVESPLTCISGVTGSDLKKRIEAIMTHRIAGKLSLAKKLTLTAAGAAALALPFVIGMLNTPPVRAQAQAASPLAFEVASVKKNASGDWRSARLRFLPGGKFIAVDIPLYVIIATAYNLPFQSFGTPRLSGGPDWIRSERYDIEAIAGNGTIPVATPIKVRDEKIRSMLQTLLTDRFKLILRRETKELPVYALVAGKNGPKLQRAKIAEKDCPAVPSDQVPCHQFQGGQGQGLHGHAVEMPELALYVSNFTDRPVVDRTGIQGLFDIETDGWVPLRPRPVTPGVEASAEDIAFADPTRPTLFMIFDRIGLKLESSNGSVEILVIDHVEKPSPN